MKEFNLPHLKDSLRSDLSLGRSYLEGVGCLFVFFLLGFLFSPSFAFAQTSADANSLTLTLVPPIFQVTQVPGTEWRSMLRVVNGNPYDIVISATVTDFHPDGETGNAVLEHIPPGDASDTHRMSGWIDISKEQTIIRRGKTGEVPFTIRVPVNADPGGHYAAILVATSPAGQVAGTGTSVSSAITSLLFMRVPGDVIEEGIIRDFYATESFMQRASGSFVIRFENKGNVHLVPQGEIVITNMWGKERGKIIINEHNTFGNVLPLSTRKFAFDWSGESNIFEFGRYKALATLAYGEDGRKNAFRATYFWVIPIVPAISVLGSMIAFFWFMSWSLRRYIRRALLLERARLGITDDAPSGKSNVRQTTRVSQQPAVTLEVLSRPLVLGVRDLKQPDVAHVVIPGKIPPAHLVIPASEPESRLNKSHPTSLYIEWLKRYRAFLLFLLVFMIGITLICWYFVEVFQSERAYQVKEVRENKRY
jgi:hypothetical protein